MTSRGSDFNSLDVSISALCGDDRGGCTAREAAARLRCPSLPARLGLSRPVSFIGRRTSLIVRRGLGFFVPLSLRRLRSARTGSNGLWYTGYYFEPDLLPEVAGDAAVVIDPFNTQELSDAMMRVLK
jgi:hypothetical protein